MSHHLPSFFDFRDGISWKNASKWREATVKARQEEGILSLGFVSLGQHNHQETSNWLEEMEFNLWGCVLTRNEVGIARHGRETPRVVLETKRVGSRSRSQDHEKTKRSRMACSDADPRDSKIVRSAYDIVIDFGRPFQHFGTSELCRLEAEREENQTESNAAASKTEGDDGKPSKKLVREGYAMRHLMHTIMGLLSMLQDDDIDWPLRDLEDGGTRRGNAGYERAIVKFELVTRWFSEHDFWGQAARWGSS
ncbi:hypothetical protein Ccrd_016897 [Cynara cardunculus var. scolymus]|uniref:Uncharacterized protein n=1 Tax=Cynara cardunculus var. scolymus TaxID=59895 RepID=A0A103Y937_CYNCS|nr:hypothetical protein Ccrd_016897 [Cynara cardunculus var. scolymus]